MLIPVGTDAPVYHVPVMTVGLALAHVGVHIAFGAAATDYALGGGLSELKQDWSLWLGDGLHPLQWVTSGFLHAGWFALIANVVFLWAFGLTVEGKLGWWKFLLLYLAMGAGAAAAMQTLSLPLGALRTASDEAERDRWRKELIADGKDPDKADAALDVYFAENPNRIVTLGADAAIFGLVAVCMVWAPKNDLTVIWIFLLAGGGSFEVPILTFALFYLGAEGISLWAQGALLGWEFALGDALRNVLGAGLGFAAAAGLLKKGWVDCENWDLFAVMKNTHGTGQEYQAERELRRELALPSAAPSAVRPGEDPDAAADRPRRSKSKKRPRRPGDPLAKLRRHLDAGDGISALGEWEALAATRPTFVPPEPDLFALAEAVDKAEFAEEAADLFALYLKHHADPPADSGDEDDGDARAARTATIRLRAARRALAAPGGRAEAARLLAAVDPRALSPKHHKMYRKFRTLAAG